MVDVSHEFVAERLWLLVAVVTLPLTAFAAVLGGVLALPGALVALLVTGIPILGWCLLTPVLLIFGDEVADAVVGPPATSEGAGDASETTEDTVESLKRRYATGELEEAEFERRLDRVLALDDVAPTERARNSVFSEEDGRVSTSGESSGQDDEDLIERE